MYDYKGIEPSHRVECIKTYTEFNPNQTVNIGMQGTVLTVVQGTPP